MLRLALLTVLATCAVSAQAAPETYVIDNSQTVANFSISMLGVSNKPHKFEKTSGKVVIDPVTQTGSAEVTIDAASVNTGLGMLDSRMQSADFFDTANFPVITFKSSKLSLGGEQMSLTGDLTIKGVTKSVTLNVTRFKCTSYTEYQSDTCIANASVTIKRSEFNMGKYMFLAGNDVSLNLVIGAVKAPAPVQVASR
ncbi:YceI family protein [Thiobacillus sp.]|uniref:YceI family protein n=1 Tax=Thiobacillus sp. TaxID=924 RepID=UPI00286E81A6|nr:YceI family protein [Thiobacillus sp.]